MENFYANRKEADMGKTKKKPMQGHEFFGRVNALLEEKGLLPEHLEYAFPAGTEEMESDGFGILGKLDYGGSEGIYLDLEAGFYETGRKVQLGVYKTLEEGDEAMREMGALYGSFIAEGRRYVREHLEEFEFTGYRIRMYMPDGSQAPYSLFVRTEDEALAEKDRKLEEGFAKVAVCDNATGETKEYTKGEKQ